VERELTPQQREYLVSAERELTPQQREYLVSAERERLTSQRQPRAFDWAKQVSCQTSPVRVLQAEVKIESGPSVLAQQRQLAPKR
jgi:hypothetical protein